MTNPFDTDWERPASPPSDPFEPADPRANEAATRQTEDASDGEPDDQIDQVDESPHDPSAFAPVDDAQDDDAQDDEFAEEPAAAADDDDADEALIERFRNWLRDARDKAQELADDEQAAQAEDEVAETAPDDTELASATPHGLPACDHEGVGIYRLVEELTALRQEVKLQARGARGLEEEVAAFLPRLRESLESVQAVEQRVSGSLDSAVRALGQSQQAAASPATTAASSQFQSLALAIAELDDALDRGRRQLERSSEQLLADADDTLVEQFEQLFAAQSALTRWASQSFFEEARELIGQDDDAQRRQVLHDALVDGYGLIQQRLARLMAKEDITRIATVGQEVDPEQMVVVEAVAADATTDPREGIVVEEIRRGYVWRGKVLRFAEVKATRAEYASGAR